MKLYVTKYALKLGAIIEIDESIKQDRFGRLYTESNREVYWEGDFHETHEAAIKKAESMRIDRIASLKKQIEKLEKLSFE